ncbi:MAG: hypothetical protein AB7O96_03160 [Pseudobdellovibrionaceae bacterium]
MFKFLVTAALLVSATAFAQESEISARTKRWSDYGTACGPYQPWGTSLECPDTSPDGGPIGMRCNQYPSRTKCFGARYWDPNFICTNPNTGQNERGSYIFNMYICR